MIEFRWIIVSSFLMLLFNFTAKTEKHPLSFTVRVGDEVTLPCENVKDGQLKCVDTTWIFSVSGSRETVDPVRLGQIGENGKSKSDRLSVTANCSLVIKKVTVADVGQYSCRQFSKSGNHEDAQVYFSVINLSEQKDTDQVTLNCSVSTYERYCRHTVEWLNEGNKNDFKDMRRSQQSCSATVTFTTSHFRQKSKHHELLKCEVTDIYTKKVQLFPFRHPSSGEKTGDDATTTTTTSPTTTTTTIKSSTTRNKWTSVKMNTSEGWRFIIVSVGLSGLLISVVTVNIWTRTKGNKTQIDENMEHNDEDEDDGTVNYENIGEPSASVRLH